MYMFLDTLRKLPCSKYSEHISLQNITAPVLTLRNESRLGPKSRRKHA